MRLSRFPELIPVTIDSRTCSGVAVDMRFSFLSRYSSESSKATVHVSWRYGKIDDTTMSREIPPKRKYELKKRAEEMAETHRRITEVAVQLHGNVRPSPMSPSGGATRAG